MKIFLFVGTLGVGGTERQLVNLALGMHRLGHQVGVVVYDQPGPLATELDPTMIPLFRLGIRHRSELLRGIWQLVRLLQQERPHCLYSFLCRPNLLAALACIWTRSVRLVWGVRSSNMDWSTYGRKAILDDWLERHLAWLPDLVIVNSEACRQHTGHYRTGTRPLEVIHNGIDTDRFHPDRHAGRRLRQHWGVADHCRLIGLPARIDPMKGHAIFLAAAARLLTTMPDVHFVCIGAGKPDLTASLQTLADRLGVADHLTWAGTIDDMVIAYNALDLATLTSSYGEGFPNVIGEAMACGIPCVVTDSGDAALIVADTGITVLPDSVEALCQGWQTMLSLTGPEWEQRALAARRRIESHFSLATMVTRTERLLRTRLALPGP